MSTSSNTFCITNVTPNTDSTVARCEASNTPITVRSPASSTQSESHREVEALSLSSYSLFSIATAGEGFTMIVERWFKDSSQASDQRDTTLELSWSTPIPQPVLPLNYHGQFFSLTSGTLHVQPPIGAHWWSWLPLICGSQSRKTTSVDQVWAT